jgi:hypothetical protein
MFWSTPTCVIVDSTLHTSNFGSQLYHVASRQHSKHANAKHQVELKAKISSIGLNRALTNSLHFAFHIATLWMDGILCTNVSGSQFYHVASLKHSKLVTVTYQVELKAKLLSICLKLALSNPLHFAFHTTTFWTDGTLDLDLLLLCGDVELNPGPTGVQWATRICNSGRFRMRSQSIAPIDDIAFSIAVFTSDELNRFETIPVRQLMTNVVVSLFSLLNSSVRMV